MKNFKILSIFFIISILVISVGAVSAADDLDISDSIVDAEVSADLDAIDDSSNIDDSNQDDLSIDEDDVEDVVIEDIQSSDESASLKEKTNILKETNGNTITVQGNTFADIQTAINSASSGDTILLSGTYYGNGNEIYVSYRNQISIIGNGYTLLDARGLSNILTIGYQNTIKNINFINGKVTDDYAYGGAVYIVDSADCVIENCTFVNNSAYGEGFAYGGAVYIVDSADCVIENCTFVNNFAYSSEYSACGGAVYIRESECIIENCTFVNNSAYVENEYGHAYGGAVYLEGASGLLSNCTFVNNSVYVERDHCDAIGGAVYWSGENSLLNNCTFINNSAKNDFYEVDYDGIYYYPAYGGAVYWADWNGHDGFLNDSKFVNNSAREGCDVYWKSYGGLLANSYFATYNSSSVYEKNLITVNNTQDKYHSLTELKNLIDAASNEITLENDYNYALDNKSGILINKNLKINGNGHIIDGMNVSHIFNVSEGCSLTIDNVIFKQSLCAIESMGILNISNSQFISNGYYDREYDYLSGLSIISLNELYLNNCTFSAGLQDIFANGSGSINNCVFRDKDYKFGYDMNGQITCVELYGNITLLNSKFNNIELVLVNAWDDVLIQNCTFYDNELTYENLISLYGNVSIMDSKFINNTLILYDDWALISTIGINGENKIINCEFINCSAPGSGAAISIKEPRSFYYEDEHYRWDNILIKDCSFTNCSSDLSGGAVSINSYCGYDYDVEAYTEFFYSNVTIVNCTFKNNRAGENGGAIFISRDTDDVYGICAVINSTFLDNQANSLDNDIYNEGNLSLSGNTLTNDFATIYNAYYSSKAMITSPVSLVILDNTTKKASVDNPFIIYAAIVDDNGNFIEDYRINLEYGSTQRTVRYNNRNGLFEYTINSLSSFANETLVSGTYNGAKILNVKTGVISLKSSVEPSVINATIDLDYLDENVIIKLKDLDGHPLSGKNILVSVNNANSTKTTDSNGEVRFKVNENATIQVIYIDNGLNVSSSLVVRVIENTEEVPVPISPNATIDLVPSKDLVKIILKDLDGRPLANCFINVTVDGNSMWARTDSKGETTLSLTGNYTIMAVYTDNVGASVSASLVNNNIIEYINKTTKRTETQIIYQNMVTTAVDVDTDGRVGKYFYITLKDKNGNALANKPVSIGFNGNVYNRMTDKDGKASLQINLKNAGTYTFAVAYLGDDKYNGSFVVAKIVVSKQKGSLTVPAKSYKASAKTKSLTATFKSASGKVVKGKKITFTVNGKTYTATTNTKGVATVNVSLNKKGTYSFTAKFAGNNMYAAMTKTAKLTIK